MIVASKFPTAIAIQKVLDPLPCPIQALGLGPYNLVVTWTEPYGVPCVVVFDVGFTESPGLGRGEWF